MLSKNVCIGDYLFFVDLGEKIRCYKVDAFLNNCLQAKNTLGILISLF